MPINVSVTAEDWQAVAQQYRAENAQLRVALSAVSRTASEQAERIAELEAEIDETRPEGEPTQTPEKNGTAPAKADKKVTA